MGVLFFAYAKFHENKTLMKWRFQMLVTHMFLLQIFNIAICLLALCAKILAKISEFTVFKNRKRKVFKILEHLP